MGLFHRNNVGQLHREDGPAIEFASGTKCWCINGKRHREDGPAVEYANGSKYWYVNDKIHRVDGPAVEYPDGNKEYWYDDVKLNCLTDEEFFVLLKYKILW